MTRKPHRGAARAPSARTTPCPTWPAGALGKAGRSGVHVFPPQRLRSCHRLPHRQTCGQTLPMGEADAQRLYFPSAAERPLFRDSDWTPTAHVGKGLWICPCLGAKAYRPH